MIIAYKRFKELMNDTSNVEVLYEYLDDTVKVPIDISDLLRWQWVQSISAFDKFIHDIVRIGIIEIFQGHRAMTSKYNMFALDMQTYYDMKSDPLKEGSILEQKIILKHSYLAFQDPSKVADALSYIWDSKDKWGIIANEAGMNKNDCVAFLKNVVIRRNQIVHEGDYIDFYSKRQDIFAEDVKEVKQFILQIGTAIYNCVKQ